MRNQCIFILLLWVILFPTAYSRQRSTPPPQQEQFQQSELLAKQVQQWLAQGNFAVLDATAKDLRESKSRFADGEWKLFTFYQAAIWPSVGTKATDLEWEPHLVLLQRWAKSSSHSVTAQVAYVGALIEFALRAHMSGQEWNSLSAESGGRLFQARLKEVTKSLSNLKKIKERCPHAYYIQLRLAVTQGWSAAEFNIPYAAGIALEPTYQYFYLTKAMNLLPRFHGGKGEWESYADELYQQQGAQEGALTYFLIISHLRPYYGPSFFDQNRMNWSRVKAGFAVLLSRYGGNNYRFNEMAFFAALAKDPITAKAAFDRIGNSRDNKVWQSQSMFDLRRAWAYDKG